MKTIQKIKFSKVTCVIIFTMVILGSCAVPQNNCEVNISGQYYYADSSGDTAPFKQRVLCHLFYTVESQLSWGGTWCDQVNVSRYSNADGSFDFHIDDMYNCCVKMYSNCYVGDTLRYYSDEIKISDKEGKHSIKDFKIFLNCEHVFHPQLTPNHPCWGDTVTLAINHDGIAHVYVCSYYESSLVDYGIEQYSFWDIPGNNQMNFTFQLPNPENSTQYRYLRLVIETTNYGYTAEWFHIRNHIQPDE